MQSAIRVDRFNAFSVNRVGLNGPGFPLALTRSQTSGITRVHGTALRAFDLVELIRPTFLPVTLVLNIGHTWMDEDGRLRTPTEIARAQGVQATTHNIGWASRAKNPDEELLELRSTDAGAFLHGWSMTTLSSSI